jgi:hypothetical protein
MRIRLSTPCSRIKSSVAVTLSLPSLSFLPCASLSRHNQFSNSGYNAGRQCGSERNGAPASQLIDL